MSHPLADLLLARALANAEQDRDAALRDLAEQLAGRELLVAALRRSLTARAELSIAQGAGWVRLGAGAASRLLDEVPR